MSPGSKKVIRIQAVELFIQADGKMSNVDIAKALHVHPLTIGKWKRADEWETKLDEQRKSKAKKSKTRGTRKKAAHDMALKFYLEAGGNITNEQLATDVGVSASSIANWKAAGGWSTLIQSKPSEVEEPVVAPKVIEVVEELLKTEGLVAAAPTAPQASALELADLTSPGQILQINRRMDEMVRRSHLTAEEVAHLARAKGLMMEAVMTYLAIVQEVDKGSVKG